MIFALPLACDMKRVQFFVVHKDWGKDIHLSGSKGWGWGWGQDGGKDLKYKTQPRVWPRILQESSIFLGMVGIGFLICVCYLNLHPLPVLEKLSTL